MVRQSTSAGLEEIDMAICINRVTLLGKAGKDPETRSTPSGAEITTLTLVTLERYKDKGGNWQDRVESHSLTAFQNLAKIIRSYVKKGSMIYVEGRLNTRSWDDAQSGKKQFQTSVVLSDLVLLSDKGEDSKPQNEREHGARTAPRDREPSPPPGGPPASAGDRSRSRGNGYDSLPGYKNGPRSVRPSGSSRANGRASQFDHEYYSSSDEPA